VLRSSPCETLTASTSESGTEGRDVVTISLATAWVEKVKVLQQL